MRWGGNEQLFLHSWMLFAIVFSFLLLLLWNTVIVVGWLVGRFAHPVSVLFFFPRLYSVQLLLDFFYSWYRLLFFFFLFSFLSLNQCYSFLPLCSLEGLGECCAGSFSFFLSLSLSFFSLLFFSLFYFFGIIFLCLALYAFFFWSKNFAKECTE
jgi:hypothetical protein